MTETQDLDLESQSHVAFGVKRGKCLAEDCPCDLYRALGELGQGGPCQVRISVQFLRLPC